MTTPIRSTTESKLWEGTLTIDGVGYACQAANVKITPKHNASGDTLFLLCGNELAPSTTRGNTLAISAVQDFDDPEGFVAMTWEKDLTDVPFTWEPNNVEGSVSYSGTVGVRAVEVGGDVRVRNMTSAEWDVVGPVVPTRSGATVAG